MWWENFILARKKSTRRCSRARTGALKEERHRAGLGHVITRMSVVILYFFSRFFLFFSDFVVFPVQIADSPSPKHHEPLLNIVVQVSYIMRKMERGASKNCHREKKRI